MLFCNSLILDSVLKACHSGIAVLKPCMSLVHSDEKCFKK